MAYKKPRAWKIVVPCVPTRACRERHHRRAAAPQPRASVVVHGSQQRGHRRARDEFGYEPTDDWIDLITVHKDWLFGSDYRILSPLCRRRGSSGDILKA